MDNLEIDAENTDKLLLSAFIGNPEKNEFYQSAAKKLAIGNTYSIGWVWSWWAFFGGWAYLLYRKAYFASLGSLLIGILLYFIPFGLILYMVLSGGLSVFFVMKRYGELKALVTTGEHDLGKQLELMKRFGGYHGWVAWFFGVVYVAWIASILIGIFLITQGHSFEILDFYGSSLD